MKSICPMTRRGALGMGLGALTLPFASSSAQSETLSPVLVELFTSQGCSSCPPADELAGLLAREPNVFVVSFSVDYWDYLGWRDTLAKPEYSQRQYDYATARGDGQVYTPQMIINGLAHTSGGSGQDTVDALINAARKKTALVPLTLTVSTSEIKVSISDTASQGDTTLWLLAIAPEVKQKIERGENAGSQVTYHNSVRNLVPAAMWKGGAYQGAWPREAVMPKDCSGCVAVLQRAHTGAVLGLARV
jgi:hypothetical protein